MKVVTENIIKGKSLRVYREPSFKREYNISYWGRDKKELNEMISEKKVTFGVSFLKIRNGGI